MLNLPIYCGGKFIQTDWVLDVVNPHSNAVFAITCQAGPEELEAAVDAARKAEGAMKSLPTYEKYQILMEIAEGLKSDFRRIAETLCRESAKPIRYAEGEVLRAIQCFQVAAEESKRIPNEYISIDWTPAGARKEGLVKYFPIGLVAAIAPFNFPLNLAVHKVAPAIASGCPVVLKPSSRTPLSTLLLAEIVDRTGLPKGAFSVLPMDRSTGNLLVTDDRFKLLSFTGSPEVGWKMKKAAGKKRVVLELGGNAGVVVSDTADLDLAAKKCLVGAFAYSGQVCIHAQRIYVDQKVMHDFLDRFIQRVNSLVEGDPLLPDTDISSMIDLDNAKRIESWVQEAVDGGAKILAGGKRQGSLYAPTVLTATSGSMKVCAAEVFGPVVVVESYHNFEDALDMVNYSRFGLQAGIFTNAVDEVNKAFDSLEVGGVVVNDVPTFRVDHMPYGGVKDSGLGREGIKYAMMEMMEPKILIKNI